MMIISSQIKRTIIFLIMFLPAAALYPADSSYTSGGNVRNDSAAEVEPKLSLPVSLGLFFNSDDLMAYGGLGFYIAPEYLLSLRGHFYYRLIDKSVFVEKTTNHYYQYKEERFGADIVLDIVLRSSYSTENIYFPGIFLAGGIGGTSASYRGSKTDAEGKGSLIAEAGIQIGRQFYCRIGYQYMKIPFSPSNHAIFEIGLSF